MKRVAFVAAVAGLLTIPVLGHADERQRFDPRDTRGPLDVKRIVHGHADADTLWHKIVMHGRWGTNALRRGEVRFFFSTDREERYDEVHVLVGLEDGKLVAWIFEYVEGSDHAAVGPSTRIRLTRPDRRSVRVFFNERWLQNRHGRYAWSVGSRYRNSESTRCRDTCVDYAPGRNPDRIFHGL